MFPRPSHRALAICIVVIAAISFGGCFVWKGSRGDKPQILSTVTTFSAPGSAIVEPFGIAVKDGDKYVSDGSAGTILKLRADGTSAVFASGFNTPSGLALLPDGHLLVADTGSHTIKKISADGVVTMFAGTENVAGSEDGEGRSAKFNGPIGIAADDDGNVFVADTYNDRIRIIERHGVVATIAGSSRGFADGAGREAKFDTPLGIAIWLDKLVVADSGNRRIRLVALHGGDVTTLAGSGDADLRDGSLSEAAFVSPTEVAVDDSAAIFAADGNAIRAIGRSGFPYVETVAGERRGYSDGAAIEARFNRPSGIAFGTAGEIVIADSDNGVIRVLGEGDIGRTIKPDEVEKMRIKAEEFRGLQPPRWPYDPPEAPREIAGTLGEIRGEINETQGPVWFHNGLDIAGAYGEVVRVIRTEKALDPHAAQNFGTARELIRLPTMGYIHLRLGRDQTGTPISNAFQFERDERGSPMDVRVRRGTTFRAGDMLGTLNSQNHIHLIAGPPGAEINALGALSLPGVSDSISPVIEKVELLDEGWNEVTPGASVRRITSGGKLRVVIKAYDRMDGNAERRRLGVYRLGYQILSAETPTEHIDWTIVFDRMPSNEAVSFAYAPGSRSGATGTTSFRYIVTNRLGGDDFSAGFIDPAILAPGKYILRAYAADYFGNTVSKDVAFEVVR